MIGMIIIMPVLQLFLFAYVASTDVTNIATAVLDEDRTVTSRALVEQFIRSGYFVYTALTWTARRRSTGCSTPATRNSSSISRAASPKR